MTQRAVLFAILSGLCALVVVQSTAVSDIREPTAIPSPSAEFVLQAASQQDETDMKLFIAELEHDLGIHQREVERAIESSLDEATDITSCGRLVGYLTYDLISNSHSTEDYLRGETNDALDPAIERLATVGRSASHRLLHRLETTSTQTAFDLCAKAPTVLVPHVGDPSKDLTHAECGALLRQFGFGATVLVPAGILDAFMIRGILRRQFSEFAVQAGARSASKILAVPVARTSASALAAAADGPLPIGDIFALGCSLWTIHDIACLRSELRDHLRIALLRASDQSRIDIHSQALSMARNAASRHAHARRQMAEKLGYCVLQAQ